MMQDLEIDLENDFVVHMLMLAVLFVICSILLRSISIHMAVIVCIVYCRQKEDVRLGESLYVATQQTKTYILVSINIYKKLIQLRIIIQ